MNFKAFLLILRRQFKKKWFRFLLASNGVAVGVWAITLTTALSFGVSDTIVNAINSQPMARAILLFKFDGGQTSFSEVMEDPFNIAPATTSVAEQKNLKNEIDHIVGVSPEGTTNVFLNKQTDDQDCYDYVFEEDKADFEKGGYCRIANLNFTVFEWYYEENKDDWVGDTNKPEQDEIVLKLNGKVDLQSEFAVEKPEDLIGQNIDLKFGDLPRIYKKGEVIDFTSQDTFDIKNGEDFQPQNYTITAVVDNTKDEEIEGSWIRFYTDYSNLDGVLTQAYRDIAPEDRSFMQSTVYIDDYNNLFDVSDDLKDRDYLAFSPAELLIKAVTTVFKVLSYVFAAFGLIALAASVFGIVNMMLISILERKKEIGILKSLGAEDRDIFWLFLAESSIIGILGWLIGTAFAFLFGWLIAFGFQKYLQMNEGIASDLESLNISEFGLNFPWWLLLSAFLLAVFFTGVSGVWPAYKAGKKDPVEVLRSE